MPVPVDSRQELTCGYGASQVGPLPLNAAGQEEWPPNHEIAPHLRKLCASSFPSFCFSSAPSFLSFFLFFTRSLPSHVLPPLVRFCVDLTDPKNYS
eukprot:207120-Rhodomonas_salina.1